MDLPSHLVAEQVKETLHPPAIEKLHELPYEQILWENFERLCLQLAKEESEVLSARPYGVKGNEQGGIDIFAFNKDKKYIVYQCKNEKDFSSAKIKSAVQKYIDGDWKDESVEFVLCTRESLQKKDRADEIKVQEILLDGKGIKFTVWDSVELNSSLKKHPQLVYDFFGIHWFIGFCGWEQLSIIKLDHPIPPKNIYAYPSGYLGRTINKVSDDNFAAYFQPEFSLFDAFLKYRKVTLLAWGLNGKSMEMENLAAILSEKKEFHPFLVHFSKYSNEPIESLIKDLPDIPEESLVVLFDGLDEALPDEFDKVCRRIAKFADDHPLAGVVVSCRTNYYTTFGRESDADTLKSFHAFTLNFWGYDEVIKRVQEIHKERAELFLDAVNEKQLFDLLRLPYYLLKLSAQFKSTNTIPNSKADIFEEETRQLIQKDIRRNYTSEQNIKADKLYELLCKLAFVMEISDTNFIATAELAEVIPDAVDRKMVAQAASIFYGTDSSAKTWRFHHHNTQEYLAAVILTAKPFSFVKRIIGIAPAFEKAKPSWFDAILFLYSILPVANQLKKEILQWITDYNKELAIKLEPELLDDAVRFKVFKSIFNIYKNEQRLINNQLYKNSDLAKFSACPVTFDYLLNELTESSALNDKMNAMDILSDADVQKFPAYQEQFKEIFKNYLFGNIEELYYPAIHGYTQHYFLNFEEFKPVYDRFIGSKNDRIRPQLFRAMLRLGLAEQFAAEIAHHLKLIVADERKRFQQHYNERLGTENGEVAKCLESLVSAKALTIIVDVLGEDFLIFAQLRNFETTLTVILGHIAERSEDETLIRKTMDLFKANHSYVLNNLKTSTAFIKFLSEIGQLDKITIELCDELDPHNASVINSVSVLASKNVIDLLFEKRKSGTIEDRLVSSLDHFFEKNGNPELKYFRDLFKIAEPEKKPAKEFATVEQERHRRDLEALFSIDQFVKEVTLLFDGFGKDDISWDDLDYSDQTYWSDKYCSIVRETLEIRPNGGTLNRLATLTNIEENWDLRYYFRIYTYLTKNNEAVVNDSQRNSLTNWCNLHITLVFFKTAVVQHDPVNWSTDEKANMLCFFIRKLKLYEYSHQLYLDMLSFLKHNDAQENIIPFVESVPGISAAAISATILSNLQNIVQNPMLLRDYLDYLKEKHITAAAPLLIPYMNMETVAEKFPLLKVYLELGGTLQALQETLKKLNDLDEFKTILLEAFVAEGHPFIRKYFISIFKKEKNAQQKMKLAGYLTRLGITFGVKYYFKVLQQTGVVARNSTEDNPLYYLLKPRYISGLLDIIKHSKEVPADHYPGQNLRSVALRALQNIALTGHQYKSVERRLKWWLFKENLVKKYSGKDNSAIRVIRFFWESVTKQHLINSGKNLKLAEALVVYNQL